MQTNTPGSLKEKFGNFGAAPTEQLWDSISSSLDQKEKKRRGIFWWWFAGIAASGLLLFGVYQFGYFQGKKGQEISNQNIPTHNTESGHDESSNINYTPQKDEVLNPAENEIPKDLNEEQVSNTNTILKATQHQQHHKPIFANSYSTVISNQQDSAGQSRTQNQSPVESNQISEIPSDGQLVSLPKRIIPRLTNDLSKSEMNTITPLEKLDDVCRYWELQFETGILRAPFSGDQQLPPPNSLTTNEDFNNSIVENSGIQSYSFSSAPELGSIYRPLNINFAARYHFRCRMAVESGLGYSLIRTQTSYMNIADPHYVNSSYHSISLPIKFSFDYVKRNRIELGIRAGIVNEIPIIERNRYSYYNSGEKTLNSLTTKGYLGSLEFNLDFGFRLGDKAKLTLSPCLRQYIVQSVDSFEPILQKNTWYGFNAGFSWKL